jgi:hypothetical protein
MCPFRLEKHGPERPLQNRPPLHTEAVRYMVSVSWKAKTEIPN